MILLWGVPGDPPLDAVYQALLHRGAAVLLVDQRRVCETTITIDLAERLKGTLSIAGRSIHLEELSGLYIRPQDRSNSKLLGETGASRRQSTNAGEALDDSLLLLAELTPALVLNRPDAMAANNSKPYQYAQIRSVGFAVPDTLITTSQEAAQHFVAQHDRVIYKSISGVRSIVGELRLSDLTRLAGIHWCPTQLQQRVTGVDVRVHVVGEELFACEIQSDAVDYRYAHLTGQGVRIKRCQLPQDCAERCIALSQIARLPLAGIDLRRTVEGEWYCFEINPSPGFTFYQHATGAPIDAAIASFLTSSTMCKSGAT